MESKPTVLPPRERFESVWDAVMPAFNSGTARSVPVDGGWFTCILAPWTPDEEPKVYVKTGLNFLVWIRGAVVRHRFVLQPLDTLAGAKRWQVRCSDIEGWVRWSNHMMHAVTFSTLKSGAGVPLDLHAQSVPWRLSPDGAVVSGLDRASSSIMVDYGEMPRFADIQISAVTRYPLKALCVKGRDSREALRQATEKVFEFLLNYDDLKAVNLVILPSEGLGSRIYLFPRRRDGNCVHGKERWQIAAMEAAGLLLCREKDKYDAMTSERIREVFTSISVDDAEWALFRNLTRTF